MPKEDLLNNAATEKSVGTMSKNPLRLSQPPVGYRRQGGGLRILISNDDGIDAPGLRALEVALEGLGEIWVVAPATGQSAKSHALTMHEPLEIQERGPRRLAVTGTPADSVYVAVHRVLTDLPDIVVSGINRGANIGEDVHYSGTVAAAREGVLLGVSALAVSLHVDFKEPG